MTYQNKPSDLCTFITQTINDKTSHQIRIFSAFCNFVSKPADSTKKRNI